MYGRLGEGYIAGYVCVTGSGRGYVRVCMCDKLGGGGMSGYM